MKNQPKFDRAKQRAMLIIANPQFQEDVKQIREKYKIPLDGIKTNEKSEEWHRAFYKSDDAYFATNRQKVREEMKRLDNEKKFQEAFNLNRKFNKEGPINSFYSSIKNLLKEHKLPLNWEHSIKRYVLFNNIDLMWLPGNVSVNEEIDQETGLVKLSIMIDDSTTLRDVIKTWPIIKSRQEMLASYTKKKFQPIRTFERDQEAYLLKQSGKSYSEIADILSEKYEKIISYEDVGSYIKRHKKRTGIN